MRAYTLDTNILVRMQREFPRDVFPGVWTAVEAMAAARTACVCQMVFDEVEHGTDELADWLKQQPEFVCGHDGSEMALVQAISNDHPGWVQNTKNEADPWVIAHANFESGVVVTEEKRAGAGVEDKNQKIPNVATEHAVPTMTFIQLARAEGWRFD